MAIGSSSKNTPLILEQLGLENYFDAAADGHCITHSKPDSEVFCKVAQRLGFLPCDCLFAEDAHAGVGAALRGGNQCAAMGHAKEDVKATYHLDSFVHLREFAKEP